MDLDNQNDFISIDEVFNLLKHEIQHTGDPQPIPPNFYQTIANLISILKEKSAEKGEDEEKKENVMENVTIQIKNNLLDLYVKSTALLFIYRYKKILEINTQANEKFDYANLTEEEKYVFYGSIERENRINIVLETLFEGKPKTLENIVSSINESSIILRFLDSMEQFVGVNMNKYGPFKKDDIAILPFENARSIIKNDKAIEIRTIN